MKKRLLVAGGGYADIPLIKAAKKLDFYVITSGNRASDLGHKYSDEYALEDFSNPEAMLNLSRKLKIDVICACCNDFSAISASFVAEKMGLKGHDSYEITKLLHHKDSYRKFALENEIASPFAKGFDNIDRAIDGVHQFDLPVIVKPVDLTGGKGIKKIESYQNVKTAINDAFSISREKKIVIEEFIEGTRHGFSAFLSRGKIVFSFLDNEHYYLNQYMVSGASTPTITNLQVKKILCNESEKIASLLSLNDGIFHVQFIMKNNKPIIIEICRRPPGDLYIQFVELSTGVAYSEWIIKAASGMDISQLKQVEVDGFYTRHCVMAESNGRVHSISFDEEIENNIIDKFMWGSKDDVVNNYLVEKFGIVFLKFDSMNEMLTITEKLPELIKVELN